MLERGFSADACPDDCNKFALFDGETDMFRRVDFILAAAIDFGQIGC